MNFTYYGADLSTTIRCFYKDNNNYTVEYLDGSISEYVCYNEEEEQRLKDIMLNQAIDRQGKMYENGIELKKALNIALAVTASCGTLTFYNNDKLTLALISATALLISVSNVRSQSRILNELKKYKLFLEMADELPGVNETELLKCVEFETAYQIPFSINNLDKYSYGAVKQIHKQFTNDRKMMSSK